MMQKEYASGGCRVRPQMRASMRAAQHGSVMVEAVIAVTFFVLILACILFVRDKNLTRHAALTHARTCAWQFAFNNCDEARMPPGCADIISEKRSGVVDGKLDEAVRDAEAQVPSGVARDAMSAGMGLVSDALAAVFGDRASAAVTADVRRPPLLGGGRVSICPGGKCGAYSIACNIAPVGKQPLAEQAWDKLVSPLMP